MVDYSKFNWGPTSQEFREVVTKEYNYYNVYEKHFEVEEGDIVLDIGASVGDFLWSILDKKPQHCWAVEPLKDYYRTLTSNCYGKPVSFVNAAISDKKTIEIYWDGMIETPKTLSFEELILGFLIEKVDFMKVDCEGGEYDIFVENNLKYLKEIKKIVIEFHLDTLETKLQFRRFRDNIIPKFKRVIVNSVDGVDISWDLSNEHFLEYYNQIIVYIDNR